MYSYLIKKRPYIHTKTNKQTMCVCTSTHTHRHTHAHAIYSLEKACVKVTTLWHQWPKPNPSSFIQVLGDSTHVSHKIAYSHDNRLYGSWYVQCFLIWGEFIVMCPIWPQYKHKQFARRLCFLHVIRRPLTLSWCGTCKGKKETKKPSYALGNKEDPMKEWARDRDLQKLAQMVRTNSWNPI